MRATTVELLRLGVFLPLEIARREGAIGAAEFAARVAGLANIRYLARIGEKRAPIPDDPAFETLVDRAGVEIVANRHALPYAQFYPQLAIVSGQTPDVIDAMVQLAPVGVAVHAPPLRARPNAELEFDFAEGARARSLAPNAGPIRRVLGTKANTSDPSPCQVARRGEPEIVLHCHFAQPGHLVVAESFAAGWQAEVDGVGRRLHPLNMAFLGLRVAPGDREIRIRYVMSGVQRASLWVSALCWTALLGYGVTRLARRR